MIVKVQPCEIQSSGVKVHPCEIQSSGGEDNLSQFMLA